MKTNSAAADPVLEGMALPFPLYAQPTFRRVAGAAWRPGGARLTSHALELCAFAPGARVVDVGCGTGLTVRLLREQGLCGLGVDSAFPALPDATATAKAIPAANAAWFVRADAAALPFKKASLDGIVCECVLSLLPDPVRVLHGFRDAVRPGGRLLLTDISLLPGGAAGDTAANTVPGITSSCLHGAVARDEQKRRLQDAFGTVLRFEDHRRALQELAAQLLWYGEEPTSRTCHEPGAHCPRFGYDLWLVQRCFNPQSTPSVD